MKHQRPVGELLREWRQRRRLSQLGLALDAEVSAKHLSFVETGRAQPSREMVLRLAERLEVPLRERNTLLLAAGFAPLYRERPLVDPALENARRAIDRLLAAHEPYPALAVDGHWNLVLANRMVGVFTAAVADATLLEAPVNVLRLSLHPRGLGARIVNYSQWRSHVLERLARQVDVGGDPVLAALLEELRGYAVPEETPDEDSDEIERQAAVVPLRLALDGRELLFFSATTVFGTPVDVTLSELAIESFFPADAATARALENMARSLSDRAS
jgi:transcriptional regulator with XRE-family HTH domain